MTTRANRIERYYDSHEVEGEELGQSRIHFFAIQYLFAVLEWLYLGQLVTIVGEVNFYQTDQPKETPKSPDVVVLEGDPQADLDAPSYYVGEDGPAPRVAFEISSKKTWAIDLEDKPAQYAAMGILEYFVFDPHLRTVWTKQWRQQNRLVGWRLDSATGQYIQLQKDSAGRLWSEELQSWLVVDGRLLRLYTRDGQLRLTGNEARDQQIEAERAVAEAERLQAASIRQQLETARTNAEMRVEVANAQLEAAKARIEAARAQIEAEKAQIEAAKVQIEAEKAKAEFERLRAAAAMFQAEAESAKAEIERLRAEKLAERLRQLNQDPDDLL